MATYQQLTGAGVTTRAAARLTGLPRSTVTRRRPDPVVPAVRPAPVNRLSPVERLHILAVLEPLRALSVARRSAVKAQQAAWRQIGALLVNAPAPLRDRLRDLTRTELLAVLAATRPGQGNEPDDADVLFALRSLAPALPRSGRGDHRPRGTPTRPRRRRQPRPDRIKGVGPVVGAQLLITAGDNPDRLRSSASFAALHHIVTVRTTYDPATRAYRDARLARGWTNKAVDRALKRAVAREIYRALTGRSDIPDYTDLRPARQAENITLTQAAHHFAVWPTHISTIERGTRRDDPLATAYRDWLTAA